MTRYASMHQQRQEEERQVNMQVNKRFKNGMINIPAQAVGLKIFSEEGNTFNVFGCTQSGY